MLARLKFEISGLVKEILDQVDPSVFQSPDKTFLDPAMGGGQFIFEIIKRLKEQGHSYDNIKPRVFGYESNILYVNYVRERYLREFGEEIPATLRVGGLEELETLKMLFDLVLSNPPYNSPKTSGGGLTKNLYVPFIIRSFELLKDGGILLMITPPGFLKTTVWGQSTPVFQKFQKYNTLKIVMKGISDYFNVGTPICYFIVEKIPSKGQTIIVSDDTMIQDLSKFSFVPRIVSKNTFSIIEKMTTPKENSVRFNILRDKNPSQSYVTFNRLNHVTNKRGSMKVEVASNGDLSYECENPELVKFVLDSTLFSWVNYVLRYDTTIYHNFLSGFYYPKTLSVWTDQELYAHFGLTDEEIRYIEEQIK